MSHCARIRQMINTEVSLACNFSVNQAFDFTILGSCFSSGNKLHVARESVSQSDTIHGTNWYATTTILENWPHEDVPRVIRCLLPKIFSPIKFHCKFMKTYYYVAIREKSIKELRRVFENCARDIHNNDRRVRASKNFKYECIM
jgi:hypothetical protein